MIPGSNKDHPSFLRSFGYAIEGFMTAVKTERNIKVMLVAGILTVIAGLVAKLQLISWALIAICIGLVIFAELCNTAMEPSWIWPRRSCTRWQSAPRTSPLRVSTCCPSPPRLWASSCSPTPRFRRPLH